VGRAASAATFDATTPASRTCRSAAGSAARRTQLGCDTGAACAGLGCASTRRAECAGTSACRSSAATTASCRATAACADLGIATRRGSASSSGARAFVGFRSAGCASAQPGVNRLGSGCSQLAAHGATGAVLERACRRVFVGRAQKRGAGGSCSAVLGCALERARGIAGLVGAFAG